MGLLRGIVTRAVGRGAATGTRPTAGGVGGVGGAARPRPGAGATGSRAKDEAIGRGVRGLLRRLR